MLNIFKLSKNKIIYFLIVLIVLFVLGLIIQNILHYRYIQSEITKADSCLSAYETKIQSCKIHITFNLKAVNQGSIESTTTYLTKLLQKAGLSDKEFQILYSSEDMMPQAIVTTKYGEENIMGEELQKKYPEYILMSKRLEFPDKRDEIE